MPPTNLSLARQVDAVCDRFEAAWRAGQAPRVEDHLGRTTGAGRAALLRALLAVEIELRRAAGEVVTAAALRKRFPDDADAVESALAEPGRGRAAGDTSVSKESVRTGHFEAPADAATPPVPGPAVPERIGRFTVTGVLGAGAFGRVYRATDPQLGRDVAIKVPLPSALESATDRERFLREARAAAALHHPNICPVHEVGEADGQPYIVMGFVPGQSLAAVLKARKEPMAPKQAALIARKLALALDAAHKKGVVHRDLKPANVMFDKERRDVVVTDFGLARAPRLGDAQTTRDGVLMGTPAYMSPEQARGDTKAVGPASDQFALGVMLYEMLTGRRPFTGTVTEVLGKILHVEPESPGAIREDLDPGLVAVCRKAMAKDPAARYGSMRQLADALAGFASDARPAAPATASAETAREPTETQRIAEVFAFTEQAVEKAIRKHRTPTWMKVGLGLLAVLAVVVPSIVFFTRSDKVKVDLTVVLNDVDLKDRSLTYFLNEEPVAVEALASRVELKPGDHVFTVKRGKDIVKRVLFRVSGGKEPGIKVEDITPAPIRADADGWRPLFTGPDLTGWNGLPGAWRLVGGDLVGTLPPGHERNTYLYSSAFHRDFELKFRVKLGRALGNSGVQVRSEVVDRAQAVLAGPQVEVDAGQGFGGLYGERTGGWMKQAPAEAVRRVFRSDQFNDYFVRVVGKRVKIVVNGETLVDDDFPGMADSGVLGFQLHAGLRDDVTFRDVMIRDPVAPAAPKADDGWTPLFNGKDLTGWKTVGEARWSWADGRLRGAPVGDRQIAYLVTEAAYDDFELELEYRLPVGANSGLFLRADLTAAVWGSGQMEVQLIDDDGFAGQTPAQATGSLYRVFARKAAPPVRRGDWNAVRVRLRQRHLEVWVNGTQTLDVDLDTAAPADRDRVPGLARRAGGIGLQRAQGPQIEFRNARVRKLGQ